MWDQHCCLPLTPTADVGNLLRFREIAASFVSANVGYAPSDADTTLAILESFRRQVADDARFLLAGSADDVTAAQAQGRLAVAFDLEDANPLEGRPELSRATTSWAYGRWCPRTTTATRRDRGAWTARAAASPRTDARWCGR
jgi:membrane dipeptidase